jgi:uncharacterized protein YbjT (DUF2867 family)
MRVFITGSSGYFGQSLLSKLLREGHKPVCLIRPGSENKLGDLKGKIEAVPGGIGDVAAWKSGLHDIDAIINLIGIIREFPSRGITFEKLHYRATADLVDLAAELGVKRFLQMSALGVSPNSRADYYRTKYRAEVYLKESELDWTIFRPSLIIGKGNKAIAEIIKLINSAPLVPIIGNGEYRMQPVDIDNVAEGFMKALTDEKIIGKTYKVGGPDRFSYNRMLDIIGEALGKKVRKMFVPVFMMKAVACAFEYFSFFPLTKGQINMLLEENITDSKVYFEELNIKPIGFKESIRKALT